MTRMPLHFTLYLLGTTIHYYLSSWNTALMLSDLLLQNVPRHVIQKLHARVDDIVHVPLCVLLRVCAGFAILPPCKPGRE